MKYTPAICAFACLVAFTCFVAAPARAADAFYIGTWKFAGAVVAPWADPGQNPMAPSRCA